MPAHGDCVSISTRNRRATIYPYGSSSDGGYPSDAYAAARGTFFCRFDPVPGGERTTGEQADHVERAVLEFADSVTISENDLIVENSVQWLVESVVLRRRQKCKVVRVFRTSDQPPFTV